jgi:hypothetical protein
VKQEIREFCETKREEIIDLYEGFQAHFSDHRSRRDPRLRLPERSGSR